MTTAPRKPKRNRGSGKLGDERAKAGVDKGSASGIHSLDPEEGELFEHDPADIGPNPMNRRIGLRGMDEMIESVRRQGVHTPGAVLHTDLFMEKYPDWAAQVQHPERTYILGPGHRRHAAALKAGKPMLAILRNSWAKELRVEENLISENNDRENLSPIEQALQLDLLRRRGMTGDEIAERSGYGSRGTVTRYLNLLDLPQEIQDEVHAGHLSQKAAYVLSTIKDDQGQNDSDAAHALHLKAHSWMRDEKLSAEAAKNRLALASAFPAGNKPEPTPAATDEADDTAKLSGDADDVSRGKRDDQETEAPAATGNGDSSNGPPTEVEIPHQADADSNSDRDTETDTDTGTDERDRLLAAAESAEQRDLACQLVLTEERYASASDLSALLVNAVLNPDEWKPAAACAHRWLRDMGKGPKVGRPSAYFTAVAASGDANLMRRAAFAIALAANEVRAAQPDREWDDRDRAHLQFLVTSKAAYQPTEYEQELLGLVSSEAK
ncbi:ParB/RepB/Spo0J family partition protein [Streptomyces sp. MBT58]|uniref:ParB/RepB/Spo0J family partition protein n=1 Tax=Streptomyces sp. MBT58 TaxID=1488389 RepID=UPI0019139ACA|nr:ParB/RepB/Spo0J family partition protein [Streptomyces sp. MBT58]MBK5993343.1 ParB/RepB/Spo0J family partition protein [Streptomyces sp. MBT58]